MQLRVFLYTFSSVNRELSQTEMKASLLNVFIYIKKNSLYVINV